jgi:ribonuclease VapC
MSDGLVLDSSAVVAILMKEPGYEVLAIRLANSPILLIGAPTLLETFMVMTSRLSRDARMDVLEFVNEMGIQVVPLADQHFLIAASAFLKFGKGRHPAALNFGDCLSYAIAARAGLPLLFQGEDFSLTDLELGANS